MVINITKSILRSILVNKEVGTIITSKQFKKLKLWQEELTPYLDKLKEMGYIDGFWKSIGVKLEILKPIQLNTITEL